MVKEIGSTGLAEWRGIIQEDFLRELRGQEGYKRYNEMRLNSPVVGALLTAIEQSIRTAEWQIVSEKGEDDPRVVLVQDAVNNMSTNMHDHIIEALTMLPFGYSAFEIVYERAPDGRLLWRKFAPRGQDTLERWEFDDKGGLAGFWQRAAPNYRLVMIPIDKMVIYRTRSEKNNPEGRSILRTAWISYYYQKNIAQIEAIGIERDLAGLPVIRLPSGASTDASDTNSDAGKAAKIVRNIRNDEQAGIVLPPEWELELLSTGGTRQFDTNAIITRYESRILMAALAQFLMLGQARVGTQALSEDQTDFFSMSVNAIAATIAETFTKYAIARLLRLNGYDPQGVSLTHSPAGDTDLTMLADFLQKASDKITWFPTDEVWLRAVANLPEADPDKIAEERERKREVQAQIFQQRRPFQGGDNEDRDDQAARVSAEMYAAGSAPDDKERRKWERRYNALWSAFLANQQARIEKSARGLKRE